MGSLTYLVCKCHESSKLKYNFKLKKVTYPLMMLASFSSAFRKAKKASVRVSNLIFRTYQLYYDLKKEFQNLELCRIYSKKSHKQYSNFTSRSCFQFVDKAVILRYNKKLYLLKVFKNLYSYVSGKKFGLIKFNDQI